MTTLAEQWRGEGSGSRRLAHQARTTRVSGGGVCPRRHAHTGHTPGPTKRPNQQPDPHHTRHFCTPPLERPRSAITIKHRRYPTAATHPFHACPVGAGGLGLRGHETMLAVGVHISCRPPWSGALPLGRKRPCDCQQGDDAFEDGRGAIKKTHLAGEERGTGKRRREVVVTALP